LIEKSRERERVIDCGSAVMFLVVCGNEVLLEERPDNEKGFSEEIIIPGGKVKNESYGDAARREIKEETGQEDCELVVLGDEFKAITTNAHLYHMMSYLVIVENKSGVTNLLPEKGKHVWMTFQDAHENLEWAHSKLVLERAVSYLKRE
jgi:8-oxo-dGTP pyrophosphatase MutT (NUDIX family)